MRLNFLIVLLLHTLCCGHSIHPFSVEFAANFLPSIIDTQTTNRVPTTKNSERNERKVGEEFDGRSHTVRSYLRLQLIEIYFCAAANCDKITMVAARLACPTMTTFFDHTFTFGVC